jgi:outer membrane receptor protein involved in Fe transport
LAGGNRYTPLDLQSSILNKGAVYIDSLAWSKRFKDYQRVDMKVTFKVNKKKSTLMWFVSIENVLNRRNIFRQVFNQDEGKVVEEYQLGLFPYGGFRIEF